MDEDVTSRTYDWKELAAQALVTPLHAKTCTIRMMASTWRNDRVLNTWRRLDAIPVEQGVEIAFDAAVWAEALVESPLAPVVVEWSRTTGETTIDAAARTLCAEATALLVELTS